MLVVPESSRLIQMVAGMVVAALVEITIPKALAAACLTFALVQPFSLSLVAVEEKVAGPVVVVLQVVVS
jgi:hypothetical protein